MWRRVLFFERQGVLLLGSFFFIVLSQAGLDALWRAGIFATTDPGLRLISWMRADRWRWQQGWQLLTQGGERLARLQAEVSSLKNQQNQISALERENALLRQELGKRTPAKEEVVARFYGFREEWFIDTGCHDGVQVGAMVTNEGRLVGQVRQVWPTYAEVQTLRDPSWRLPVNIGTASARGLFQSARGEPEVSELHPSATFSVGEQVVTVGFQNIPPDVVIGEVSESITRGADGQRVARVRLSIEPESAAVVFVQRSDEVRCL